MVASAQEDDPKQLLEAIKQQLLAMSPAPDPGEFVAECVRKLQEMRDASSEQSETES